jgi:hypothetical protein
LSCRFTPRAIQRECVRVHKLMKDHLLAAAEQAEAELLAET